MLSDLFLSNYDNELRGCYEACIFRMCYAMALYSIPLLNSTLKAKHGLALNLCGFFLCVPLPSLLKSEGYPYCYGILGNFVQFGANSSFIKPLTRNHLYLVLRVPRVMGNFVHLL